MICVYTIDSATLEKYRSVSHMHMSDGEEVHTHLLVSKQRAYTLIVTIVTETFLQKDTFLNTSLFKLILVKQTTFACMSLCSGNSKRQQNAMGAIKPEHSLYRGNKRVQT